MSSTFTKYGSSVILAFALGFATTVKGTITVQTNILGPTPTIVGYDSAHFYPGGNAADWWHYSGVSGARIFVSPTEIEPVDELPPWGDGVTNESSFIARKALVRSDPWNTNYFNWPVVTNRFATTVLTGSDYIVVDYTLSNLMQLGVQTVIDSTATASKFTNVVAWGDQWELWHYYYEEAFYLGAFFNVQRYQMYNEPDNGGPTGTNYLARLQLASDAVQSAIADVDAIYGKSLTPMMLAPVTAGAPTSTYPTWGKLVVTNRHLNYLGQTDTNFSLIQKYDYHQYGGSPQSPTTFSTDLTYLQGQLQSTMAPETPYPATITEFNVYDGSTFNGLSTTLDTPSNYSAFAAIAVDLIQNNINEIYCFKIGQTVGSGYIAKNGTHYIDNTNAPYNIGGITKGGEAWRLINKGFAPGCSQLGFTTDRLTTSLNVLASYDPVGQRYYVLSVNNTVYAVPLALNLSAWQIPSNNLVLAEAVNENCYGGGAFVTNLTNSTFSLTQGTNSVWLFTIPAQAQQTAQVIPASANSQVNGGSNVNNNYAGAPFLLVENNSTNAGYRSAALLQFPLTNFSPTNLQLALLTVNASSANGSPLVEGYVYGIVSNNWSESSVTWASAPNLQQGVAPGVYFTNNFVSGAGITAFMLGQVVAGASPATYNIDVTSFVKTHGVSNVSFLIVRGVRYIGDVLNGDGLSIVSREGSASSGPTLRLTMNPPPIPIVSPALAIQSIGGEPELTLSGMLNSNYIVQYNSNLLSTNWINLYNVTNLSNSPYLFADPAGFSQPQRFYRAFMH